MAQCCLQVPSSEVGRKIAHSLVESKLAACVQIIPGGRSLQQPSTLAAGGKGFFIHGGGHSGLLQFQNN